MRESIERMRKLVNENLVMGLRFQMNGELNKLESEIEQELNSRAVELIANCDESIHNLVKVLDKRQERIKALESLVLDWAMAPCAVCDPWDEYFACEHFDGDDCTLGIRMAELGIEVGE